LPVEGDGEPEEDGEGGEGVIRDVGFQMLNVSESQGSSSETKDSRV